MKIKELLESLSEVKRYITEIRINGFKFNGFDDYKRSKGLLDGDELEVCNSILKGLEDLDVMTWGFTSENEGLVLVIHAEESQDSEEDEEELTVGDVLSSICFDDENTIVIFGKTDSKVYDSDEDSVFALCELLCLDVKEYIQIHRGKHQTIEIYLKNY